MLNGDGNDNGIKINRSIQQKNKLHLQHAFFSNKQKKNKFARAARFFVFLCRCFAPLQRCFVQLKRQTSQFHIIFMKELAHVLSQFFSFLCSCSLLFFTAARSLSRLLLPFIFTLLFSFLRDSSPLFSITRFSSVSVMHVSVNITNNVEYKVPAIILPTHVQCNFTPFNQLHISNNP